MSFQTCYCSLLLWLSEKQASYRWHDISDETWALLEPLLPSRVGSWGGVLDIPRGFSVARPVTRLWIVDDRCQSLQGTPPCGWSARRQSIDDPLNSNTMSCRRILSFECCAYSAFTKFFLDAISILNCSPKYYVHLGGRHRWPYSLFTTHFFVFYNLFLN